MKAAEKGHPVAAFELSRCFMSGNGVDQSDSDAFRWMAIACNLGFDPCYLGMFLLDGFGCEMNKEEGQALLSCSPIYNASQKFRAEGATEAEALEKAAIECGVCTKDEFKDFGTR